jgi:serine-threonine kinase receptor-associated protein
VWDIRAGTEVQKLDFDAAITSMELSADGNVLTATHGQKISFFDAKEMKLVKDVAVAAPAYTASRHPDGKTFVWGGIDNLLHVVNYETGEQQEEYKGHFGPVHCVRYSPDGEMYASGSEDGTVRLWQTRVGLEYGLWCFDKPAAMGAP